MKPPVEEVRISAKSRDILIKVKRRTGIIQWNHLCRIAFCRSLANPAIPIHPLHSDTGVRMDWKTFAGPYNDEFVSLTLFRAREDGIDVSRKDDLAEYFRAHLERGIGSLSKTADILTLATKS